MEKEFVPYELAVKMKELGFDKDCFKVKVLGKEQYDYTQSDYADFPEQREKEVLIPLWQQAFDWFRETKNLFSIVNWYRVNGNPNREFLFYIDVFEVGSETKNKFETYELARTACLEKLIEITNP
mgnify:FL=1